MGERKKTRAKDLSEATVTDKKAERLKKQHEVNLKNAQVIIGHAMDTVRQTRIDKSLIEILKTVRHWPSLIDGKGQDAVEPAFNATEIGAEETTLDDHTITRVSFSYSGKRYGLVYRTQKSEPGERTTGTITLHEDGEKVIGIEVLEIHSHDIISYSDLNAFKNGEWMENVALMEKEIEAHRAETSQTQDAV